MGKRLALLFRMAKYQFIVWVSLVFLTLPNKLIAQGAQKIFNPIYEEYFDSLKNSNYPYTFPVLGKKAYAAGYDLPYAWGASAIYFTQRQEITISKTLIGFNGGEQVDLSEFIRFGPVIANSNAFTMRPDLWVLPFLNVYGIIGGGFTQTDVNLVSPVSFETSQRFKASSLGVGATLTGSAGPVWVAWDNNFNFVDVEVVVEPVPAFNSSLRIGHTVPSISNPQRNLSVWVGTFYQSIKNDTQGSITIADVFPGFGEGNVINQLNEWAETLPPAQRVVVKQIIQKLEDFGNGIDPGTTTIDYQIKKEVTVPFNMILGAQYQFNKNWMLRSEMGVFGKRSQFLVNVNWRFPGFRKN